MTTIFISSTAKDLMEHRKKLIETLSRMSEVVIAMEHFGSRGDDAVEVCREEIDRCDVFVGIYAWRYGFVPLGATRSITEQEFDHAREKVKTCLCYVVDDEHPWPPKWIEGGVGADRLRAFKEKVFSLVVSRFTTPENLSAIVAADLTRELKKSVVQQREESDLRISSLSSPGRILPLAGYPVLSDPSSGGPVYTAGCKVSFSLSHNGRGADTLTLFGMRLNVHSFVPGIRPDLAYRPRGDAIHAAGSMKPHEFAVSVDGEQVLPARWILEGKPRRSVAAGSWNFFDIPHYPRITLAPGGADIEEIVGHILTSRAGLYELSITFYYSVTGTDRQIGSDRLRIYSRQVNAW
jgi:hypothetical protein